MSSRRAMLIKFVNKYSALIIAKTQPLPIKRCCKINQFSGGISNMIDRVLSGAVIDFMNIGIGNLRTGIFNVADMAIMAGLFLVVIAHLGAKAPPSTVSI